MTVTEGTCGQNRSFNVIILYDYIDKDLKNSPKTKPKPNQNQKLLPLSLTELPFYVKVLSLSGAPKLIPPRITEKSNRHLVPKHPGSAETVDFESEGCNVSSVDDQKCN